MVDVHERAYSRGQRVGVLGVLQRPILGPWVFGLVCGGVPLGITLYLWGMNRFSVNADGFIYRLTPLAIFLAALGAQLSREKALHRVLWRALLASLGACVLIPSLVWGLMIWHHGDQVFDIRNLPFIMIIFVFWALAVALPGGLLAFAYLHIRNRDV